MQRILYIVQKEFRQIVREKLFIGLIFGSPFIQILLLGFAITTDVKHVALTIVDYDHSAMSRRLTDAFRVTESFDFKGKLASEQQAARALDRGEAKLALIIPTHFERDLKSGLHPKVQALVDGVDGNSAGVALAYVNLIAMRLQKEWLQDSGQLTSKRQAVHLTELETRMLYNPSLESVNNIVPGILALLIMMITSFLTGMSIVREREIGTLEQLMVTPIRNMELILGKVIPLAVVAFLLFSVGILAAGLVFGLWPLGNVISLYLTAFVFSLSTLGFGIVASTFAHTQQQAMFITWFFSIFAILLSGFFIPIENMPQGIQWITYLNPVRYFMVIIREIYLKGTGMIYLWKEVAALAVFGLFTFIGASLRFTKRLT